MIFPPFKALRRAKIDVGKALFVKRISGQYVRARRNRICAGPEESQHRERVYWLGASHGNDRSEVEVLPEFLLPLARSQVVKRQPEQAACHDAVRLVLPGAGPIEARVRRIHRWLMEITGVVVCGAPV